MVALPFAMFSVALSFVACGHHGPPQSPSAPRVSIAQLSLPLSNEGSGFGTELTGQLAATLWSDGVVELRATELFAYDNGCGYSEYKDLETLQMTLSYPSPTPEYCGSETLTPSERPLVIDGTLRDGEFVELPDIVRTVDMKRAAFPLSEHQVMLEIKSFSELDEEGRELVGDDYRSRSGYTYVWTGPGTFQEWEQHDLSDATPLCSW